MSRVLIIDDSDDRFVGRLWKIGASLFSRHFSRVIKARRVEDVYEALSRYAPGTIDHLQLWTHASAGRVSIGRPKGAAPSEDYLLDRYNLCWDSVRGGVVWFRGCKVMQAAQGRSFAATFASRGISVAGHLSNIGNFAAQSYLVGVKAYERPWWSAALIPDQSFPWAPRTVSALDMDLPAWAFSIDRTMLHPPEII